MKRLSIIGAPSFKLLTGHIEISALKATGGKPRPNLVVVLSNLSYFMFKFRGGVSGMFVSVVRVRNRPRSRSRPRKRYIGPTISLLICRFPSSTQPSIPPGR